MRYLQHTVSEDTSISVNCHSEGGGRGWVHTTEFIVLCTPL